MSMNSSDAAIHSWSPESAGMLEVQRANETRVQGSEGKTQSLLQREIDGAVHQERCVHAHVNYKNAVTLY